MLRAVLGQLAHRPLDPSGGLEFLRARDPEAPELAPGDEQPRLDAPGIAAGDLLAVRSLTGALPEVPLPTAAEITLLFLEREPEAYAPPRAASSPGSPPSARSPSGAWSTSPRSSPSLSAIRR